MILKCYFDGGNQAEGKQYDVVTLAAVCGTNDQLKPFENDWIIRGETTRSCASIGKPSFDPNRAQVQPKPSLCGNRGIPRKL